MRREISGYHKDEEDDWVADLVCGHCQHVRHDPPWQNRPWVETESGRNSMLGTTLDCKKCDSGQQSFISIATSMPVVQSATRVALLFGSILAMINHGQDILRWSLSGTALLQVLLTYLVPYCVSTYSAVRAIQRHQG